MTLPSLTMSIWFDYYRGISILPLPVFLYFFPIFEVKTFIASYTTFGRGKFRWVGVNITLVDASASTGIARRNNVSRRPC